MKRRYEKPSIVKQKKMEFVMRGLSKIAGAVCRACSSCHGCR